MIRIYAIIGLVLLLLGSGYLLQKSYKSNGKLTGQVSELLDANAKWSDSVKEIRLELDKAQERMVKREKDYQAIRSLSDGYRKQLREAQKNNNDVNCISDAGWLLIEDSANYSTIGNLPSD